ncbi:DUF4296 domain-containing protein [Terrimonas ferruginea]|uniref:DUF4296 domain-containing protein n=1 Tax=Terrimonas ferruginea TaxID=249 RepID=UPI0004091C9E|nr:DUF4296 domain-containing protein [Terrimonas ferruginea]
MKRLLLSCCLLAAILVGCGNKNKIPSDIMPREKMDSVLWDMLRAGEFINGYVQVTDTGAARGSKSVAVYEEVLRVHKITRRQFDESFAWYRAHPDQMKRLLDTLAKRPYTGDSTGVKRTDAGKDSLLPALKGTDSLLKRKRAELRAMPVPQKPAE